MTPEAKLHLTRGLSNNITKIINKNNNNDKIKIKTKIKIKINNNNNNNSSKYI